MCLPLKPISAVAFPAGKRVLTFFFFFNMEETFKKEPLIRTTFIYSSWYIIVMINENKTPNIEVQLEGFR